MTVRFANRIEGLLTAVDEQKAGVNPNSILRMYNAVSALAESPLVETEISRLLKMYNSLEHLRTRVQELETENALLKVTSSPK